MKLLRIVALMPIVVLYACAGAPKHATLTPDAQQALDFYYERLGTEFAVCAKGHKRENTLLLEGFELTPIEESNRSYVRFVKCNNSRFLGNLHVHYDATECKLSESDIQTLAVDGSRYGFVYCGSGQLAFSTKKEAQETVKDMILGFFK